jgi:hypothetical protein
VNSDLNSEMSSLLPGLLWSHLALGWKLTNNDDFWHRAADLMIKNQLTYSSKVLLSQALNDSTIAVFFKSAEFVKDCKIMQYHYELLDIRENSTHYKTLYGLDIANELQLAFKQQKI